MSGLTSHGRQRAGERLGLSAQSADRLAERALESGVRAGRATGSLRKYLDALAIGYRTTPVVYGRHVYCFGGDKQLVTVLHLPKKYFKAVDRLAVSP